MLVKGNFCSYTLVDTHQLEKINLEIRAILKTERIKAGLSMNRLGEIAGLSQQAISYLERDMRDPSLDTLLRVSAAIGVDFSKVVTEAEKKAKK